MSVLKVLLAVVVTIIVFYVGLSSALSYYDSGTRQRLLGIVGRELPPHASISEMTDFMRRHTTRSALDEEYHHEFSGFVPQTRTDRFLFDRKVQIVLKVADDHTFLNADVRVYYTGL
jgi:hypothetical protein